MGCESQGQLWLQQWWEDELKILRGGSKVKSNATDSSEIFLEKSHKIQPLILKNPVLQAQKRFIPTCRKSKASGGLHWWASCSWLNSHIQRKYVRGGSRGSWPRGTVEVLSSCVAIELGRPRSTWCWIWLAMWRATRKYSTKTKKTQTHS